MQIGNTIAQRYDLLEEIGRGGFGVIFRAQDRQQRLPVALKILHAAGDQLTQEQLEQRFRREALMASSLKHPHSIRQYDYGRCSDCGALYIAMELLHGETLAERLTRSGPFSPELVSRVARGVLRVLSAAHTLDIVHRDLKPANIMLCAHQGEDDFVKVLDFGIAKTMLGNHDLTSAGMALGSPTYMPPELLLGKAPVPASDLYSLGLTLAETIIGAPLAQGASALERARAQIAPAPLPAPDVLMQHPLWPWLSRALAKDISRRFASAEDMLRALDTMMPPPQAAATLKLAAISGPGAPLRSQDARTIETTFEPEPEEVEGATLVMELPPGGFAPPNAQNKISGVAASASPSREAHRSPHASAEAEAEADTHNDMRPLLDRLESDPDDATEMMENPLEMLRQAQALRQAQPASPSQARSQAQATHTDQGPTPVPGANLTPGAGLARRSHASLTPVAPTQPASRGFDAPPAAPHPFSFPAAPPGQQPAPPSRRPAWLSPLNIFVAVLCVLALVLLAILLTR
ncbi:hypothetical protein DL240_00640 [Lujinxingia litoralis]|uniref:non-specific serine/threonine protein kinase n=1 Tax=Lujinxingia litoralis TaxID=2211119 RepID=A0A328CC65_9DELT|nr:serine/threonine-protein kinase [Lujinxingia litoralis]RAL24751.1 hypothetical protein DL240_00640 [Lujinxingia litoralis]